MKKILSILSLSAVIIILGLSSCSEDDGNKNSSSNNSDSQNSSSNNSDSQNSSKCIKCDDYEIGETFSIDGVTYTVADREMLDEALENGEDMTKFCTSKVTDMSFMFTQLESLNQDIGNWDVSNVTDMSFMFDGVTSFNQDIGSWDVSKVTDMGFMFSDAASFNQDLTQWCVSNIDSEPSYFSFNSELTPENHPVWGTCPE